MTSSRSRVWFSLRRTLRSAAIPVCVFVDPARAGSLSVWRITVTSGETSHEKPPGYDSLRKRRAIDSGSLR